MSEAEKLKAYQAQSGVSMAAVNLLLLCLAVLFLGVGDFPPLGWLSLLLSVLMLFGYKSVSEGEGSILTLFGKFQGVLNDPGFYWVHPLYRSRAYSSMPQYTFVEQGEFSDKQGIPLIASSQAVWEVASPDKLRGGSGDLEGLVVLAFRASIAHVLGSMSYEAQGKPAKSDISIKGSKVAIERAIWDNLRKRIEPHGLVVKEVVLLSCQAGGGWAEQMQRHQRESQYRKEALLQAVPTAQYMLKQWKASEAMPRLSPEEEKKLAIQLILALSSHKH